MGLCSAVLLVATVAQNSGISTTTYVHTDHLIGWNPSNRATGSNLAHSALLKNTDPA